MAIKGGDLIHVGNQVLIDRAQTAGPGTVNIPATKIYELGNYKAVGTVYDIPDISFSVESLDAAAEFEAMLLGLDFATMPSDNTAPAMDLAAALPMDIVSQFKPGRQAPDPYNVLGSVGIPFLALETASYRFGLTDNASQTFTLRGDSIFYNPGAGMVEVVAGTNAANQDILLAHPAHEYTGDTVGGARYTLSVSTVSGRRLRYGTDYTEAVTGTGDARSVTVTIIDPVPATDSIRIVYSTSDVLTYPQASHALASAVRPAAIRGRNIEVLVGGTAISNRWSNVQSVNLDWRVTLDRDLEFGNDQIVSQDFEVPDVTGAIEIKPRNYTELYDRVVQVAGTPDQQVVGATTFPPLEVMVLLHSPEPGGGVLKTFIVPDARITFPNFQGRVQQKMNVTMNLTSDQGVMQIFKGDPR